MAQITLGHSVILLHLFLELEGGYTSLPLSGQVQAGHFLLSRKKLYLTAKNKTGKPLFRFPKNGCLQASHKIAFRNSKPWSRQVNTKGSVIFMVSLRRVETEAWAFTCCCQSWTPNTWRLMSVCNSTGKGKNQHLPLQRLEKDCGFSKVLHLTCNSSMIQEPRRPSPLRLQSG